MPMTGHDKRAVDILLRTYWSSEGWREPPSTPADDLAYARAAGVMFEDPVSAKHDDVVAQVVKAAASVASGDAANAFLSSLTTRRLDRRSILGSYAVAKHLVEHDLEPWYQDEAGSKHRCALCGLWSLEPDIDWSLLSFERYKWGGVRRDDLTYVLFDLQQFCKSDEQSEPTGDDVSLFRQLITELESQPADESATKAQGRLRILPSNKDERMVFLDILGVCGVLETSDHHGYSERFVPANERELPPLRFVERSYPVCWWKGSDGVNRRALTAFNLPI